MDAGTTIPTPSDCTSVLSTKEQVKKQVTNAHFLFLPVQGDHTLSCSLRVQGLISLHLGANCSPYLWIYKS